jgi:hypothetical protein
MKPEGDWEWERSQTEAEMEELRVLLQEWMSILLLTVEAEVEVD